MFERLPHRGYVKWSSIALLLASLVFLVAGCGGSSSSSSSSEASGETEASSETTEESGGGESAEGGSGKPKEGLKLAYYSVGSNNTYLQAGIKAAEETAKKYGDSIDVFDGEFDGGKQLNQVIQGVTSGDYDGIILEPVNSQELCSAATQAIEAEIPIGITNVPICTAEYEEAYEGTSIFVGGQSPEAYEQWFQQGLSPEPAGGEFGVMVGPPTQGNTIRAREVLDDTIKPEFPKWDEVAFDYTEYQASVALAKTQTLLQKNPDVSVIFSSYAGSTGGVISAVAAAGSKAKIYDLGGAEESFKAIREGKLESTLMLLPVQEAERAVQAVVAQASGLEELEGVEVGSYWDLTKDPALHGLSPFATKQTLPKYEAIGLPQY